MKEPGKTSKLRRKLAIMVSCILIVGLICTTFFLYPRYTRTQQYCYTPACKRSAEQLLSSMNTSVDPCENFYQFACGNFGIRKESTNYRSYTDWFDFDANVLYKNISDFLARNVSLLEPLPIRQAKAIYKQCMDTADHVDGTFKSIANLLEEVGLPILPPLFKTSDNFSLVQRMVRSKLMYNKDFFIASSMTIDPKNQTRYRLYISKPSEIAPLPLLFSNNFDFSRTKRETQEETADSGEEENYTNENYNDENSHDYSYLDNTNSSDVSSIEAYTEAFREYVRNVAKFAYNYAHEEWTNEVDKAFDTVVKNLTTVYLLVEKITATHFSSDSAIPIPVHVSIQKLQNLTDLIWPENNTIPKIDWKEFFTIMFNDIPEVTLNFDDDNVDGIIVVKDWFHISTIMTWLGTTSPQILELYMWWITVFTVAPYSSSEIRKYSESFFKKLNDVERPPRHIFCSEVINNMYGMVTAYPETSNTAKIYTIQEVLQMVENIQISFQSIIQNIAWMDTITKTATMEKLKRMKRVVGFPPWLSQTGELEKYYEEYAELEIDKNDFLINVLKVTQISSVSERKSYRKEINVDEEMWSFNPMDVNAYNWLEGNRITIPIGILQFPFYEHGLQVLNYGAIGTIIGHELTHGFDNTGKEYDATGLANPWWTNDTITEFNNRARCFVDYYNSFHDSNEETQTDATMPDKENTIEGLNSKKGVRTLDENIADNGGLRNAFYAYKNYVLKNGREAILHDLKQYSSDQLFFLSFAHTWCKRIDEDDDYSRSSDEHSPNHVRVWGTLSNSKEFSQAWKCKAGTPMNPVHKKCEMW